jgi:hypothetical protein
MRQAWKEAGRPGQPRIATGRYVGLGDDADAVTDVYILLYYGDESFHAARADTLTTLRHLRAELRALRAAPPTRSFPDLWRARTGRPAGRSPPEHRISPGTRSRMRREPRDGKEMMLG